MSRSPDEVRVLVADDEPFVRKTLSMLLSSLGFTVIEAENGAEAVAQFREHRAKIVLVIMDMTMPVLSGADALRGIKHKIPGDAGVADGSGADLICAMEVHHAPVLAS